eukprot:CAMPEP_0185808218 /NCGR_PEP_ID=MMETSP1322-20130828/5486_1 /TAXON_ID=265543 /ORGANISM="Minutocellus polymorphus, Strain RCC2270" /LENGTH=603 /DNA_ID=CAMNT_0028504421 /DNA_START=365 /DNA_END=2176 /DNA_ORIENTATION=+
MSSHTLPDIIARLYAKIPEAISSSSSDGLLPGSLSFGSASTTIILVIVTSTLVVYRSSLKHRLRDVSVHLSDGTVRKLLPQRRTSYWFVDHERLDPAKSCSTISSTAGSETSKQRTLRRRMTAIGRFALRSQTKRNPCIITFFVASSNPRGQKGMGRKELEELWSSRVMEKHERFHSRISSEDDRYFEVIDKEEAQQITEVAHPTTYRTELQERIEQYLTSDLQVDEMLWEGQVSTGPLGSSGAISNEQIRKHLLMETCDTETVKLFRVHHAIADGVSMGVVLADASDEADELDGLVMAEVDKRRRRNEQRSILERATRWILMVVLFYIVGGIKAVLLQAWRMFHSVNPFDSIIAESKTPAGKRTVAWRTIASVDEIKKIAKSISKKTTINDVSVFLVTAAIKRQLAWHYGQMGVDRQTTSIPSHINICVPVHLLGGMLVDPTTGKRVPVGNKIGAFVAAIPTAENDANHPAAGRVKKCSAALTEQKTTPAPLIAWAAARFFSDYAPLRIAKYAMKNTNGQSAAVVSNVKGLPFKTHWNGRRNEVLCAFLPLPPGIPIGCVIQSYGGEVSFSIDADKRAVPDAGQFADWMLYEYERLKQETGI